ncbi:DUF2062 domain-containing protein [candidate division CSSED10-310 bacterium]|uniref:DUF2062 domain-containing protein n=1 Tax=candidate division CSSED10-310 bacterium TaxID=2855610 RepID=A0ABV6Z0N2_UNCC1
MNENTTTPPRIQPLVVIRSLTGTNWLHNNVERALLLGLPVLLLSDHDGACEQQENPDVTVMKPDPHHDGARLQIAENWARINNYSHLITIDADKNLNLGELENVIPEIEQDPTSIIFGYRVSEGVFYSESGRLGQWWSKIWMRLACGYDAPDLNSGFRVFPIEVLNQVKSSAHAEDYEFDILIRAIWAGVQLNIVPVSIDHPPTRSVPDHDHRLSAKLQTLYTYSKLIVRNCLPLPHKKLFNVDQDAIEFSWSHPLRYVMNLHRRVSKKLSKEEQQLSLRHPIRSLKILHLERISPKEIALACMLGIFLGASPVLGFHTIAIIFYATRFRLNRAIAFYASNPCAPIFPPFIPAWEIELGFYFRNGRFITLTDLNTQEALFRTLCQEAHLRLWEYFLGWLVIGPLLALVVGFLVYSAALFYQRNFH